MSALIEKGDSAMDGDVRSARTDGARIAHIIIDNPPVNVMTSGVRERLLSDINVVIDDPSEDVIVIRANGNTFVSGADLKELGRQLKAGLS